MQLWKDGRAWVRAQGHSEVELADGADRLRLRQVLATLVVALVLLAAGLAWGTLRDAKQLQALQAPGVLGPLVVEPAQVRGLTLYQVVGARPPIYFGEGVPLETVEWAREGLQIAWQEVPRITGFRHPGDETPLYLFADHQQFQTFGQRLWGSRFGQLGWERCTYLSGRATACNAEAWERRAAVVASLAHELTHQLVYAEWVNGQGVPLWFNEGLATYVGDEVYAAQSATPSARGIERADYVEHALRFGGYKLLGDLKWNTTDEQFVAYAYSHSWLAVRSLVERFGMTAVIDLARRAGARPFAEVFVDVFGRDVPAFETELEQSLRTTLRGPGRLLYDDDFAASSTRWRRSWTDRTLDQTAYADGEYALRLTGDDGPTAAVWNRLPFSDFDAQISARLLDPAGQAAVFLDFRIQPNDNRYRFSVDPVAGQFALHEVRTTDATAVIADTPADAIRGGTARNRLGVRAEGPDVVLLVNGQEVGRAQTGRARVGRLGFGVTSLDGEPAEARFSDLVVMSVN